MDCVQQCCQCGDSLHGVVHCDRDNKRISLLKCYCMSYNRDSSTRLLLGLACNVQGNGC